MSKYHGPLFYEKRDKPRLDSVKGVIAAIMTGTMGPIYKWTVPQLHEVVLEFYPCREDTVRRMLNYLMREGTETHTFHSRESESHPGTCEYTARRKL